MGYEAAGHPSPYEIGRFVLFNEVIQKLKIPLLAGGGIADGRGMAAALAMVCEGVVIGTRFVACKECGYTQTSSRSSLTQMKMLAYLPAQYQKSVLLL